MQLDKQYDPKNNEQNIYSLWENNNCFKPNKKTDKGNFIVVIPPPNVTDVLHLGHALNNTIQDLIVRFKRMQGYRTLWVPGTDHAGIATQNMVERQLAKEGKTKEDIGREKFTKLLWQWKNEKGDRIIEQLKEIGCSCDWSRTRFTMDDTLSKAVREAFYRLYSQGLIYRGRYIVNWCPHCKTALSDDEVEHTPSNGSLWYITYPFQKDGIDGITVATTRPETMLGDVAIAVNPDDERYATLIGKKVWLPLTERFIPIIADKRVTSDFGTGAVKVTPAHDPLDFEIGQTHKFNPIFVISPEGNMSKEAGSNYEGMDRYECRRRVILDLKALGLLIKIEPHSHSVGHCYRCDTVIEPYLSSQWFVKMKPLAHPALEIVKRGKIKFTPERWTGVYYNWMENIRDWCISRQIWWGHRIPLWECKDCGETIVSKEDNVIECPKCGSENLFAIEDVLDTWFSSWLWPFTVMGWPEYTDDFNEFYPTDILVTASEIIFFWVARMVMAGIHFTGELPFKDVLIHGTVRDEQGRKMSKSLGNGIDPLKIVESHGRDALRFTLVSQSATGSDLFLSEKTFDIGRNFINKLWNATRLILSNLNKKYDYNTLLESDYPELSDRYILSRFQQVKAQASQSLTDYDLYNYVQIVYHFFWDEFCDWELEVAKDRLREGDDKTIKLLLHILIGIFKLLHPVIPFLTERLWQIFQLEVLKNLSPSFIIDADFPVEDKSYIDQVAENEFDLIKSIITSLRTTRNFYNISYKQKLTLTLSGNDKKNLDTVKRESELIQKFGGTDSVIIKQEKLESPFEIIDGLSLDLPIAEYIDLTKERERIEKEINTLQELATKSRKKLESANFLSKAPSKVVEMEKGKLSTFEEKIDGFTYRLKQLEKKGR